MASSNQPQAPARPAPARTALAFVATSVIGLLATAGCGESLPAYQLVDGPKITLGEINRPTLTQVQGWTDELQRFWQEQYGAQLVRRSLTRHAVLMADEETILLTRGPVYGYTLEGVSVVGMRLNADQSIDWEHVRRLYMHEVAHAVLLAAGVEHDEALHHQIFAELHYGY